MHSAFSPLLLKMALGFVAVFVILAMAMIFFLYLRRELVAKPADDKKKRTPMDNAFVLAGYDSVLKQVKEQERELNRLRKSERENKTNANQLTDSVLHALNAGLIQFNAAAIIRTADTRARALLGYASPTGMHARDIFKGVLAPTSIDDSRIEGNTAQATSTSDQIVQAIQNATKAGGESSAFQVDYCSPSGEQRKLCIAIFPLAGDTLEVQGAGCVVTEVKF